MIERNIIDIYNQATAEERQMGSRWYQAAHTMTQHRALKYGLPIQNVAGVIAAISPGLRWIDNIIDAEHLIAANKCNEPRPMVGVYGTRNRDRAWLIASGEDPLSILGGLKVINFYHNILDPSDAAHVTIDRHAYCLAHGLASKRATFASVEVNVTPKRYAEIADAYRALSRAIGLLPNQLQAITWLAWKRINAQQVPF